MTTLVKTSTLLLGFALSVGALTGCSGSDSGSGTSTAPAASESVPSASATPSGTPVASADLKALVSDRTFSGVYEGTPYTEYYAPDGTISGQEQGGDDYTASWELSGDTLCFTYPEDDPDSGPDCYTAQEDGSNVYWFNPDGSFSDATTYVEGNPNNL